MKQETKTSPLKQDVRASLVVFLVALPLCMGIANASGVPAHKSAAVGVITAVVGGIVVGLLSGCPLQVSGPAAGLSVVILELFHRLEARYPDQGWGLVGLVVLLAGVVQLLAGLLRLGQWFRAVSPAVIHGMLAGIGVLIFASQIHVLVDNPQTGSGLSLLLKVPASLWKGIVPQHDSPHDEAARIGLVSIGVLLLWRPLTPRFLHVIPAPLVAVLAAVGFALAPGYNVVNFVSMPQNLSDAVQLPTRDVFTIGMTDNTVWTAVLTVAFIASAETLLCASAVDQMHVGPRCKYDKELSAQGVGNVLCGLLGMLPITGVVVRSAVNVEAGARTRLSAILHGVLLLALAVCAPFLFRYVPSASLAALLVVTGIKLVNLKELRHLRKYGRTEVVIWSATLISIVCFNLLTGILVGVLLAVAKLVYVFSHLRVRTETDPDGVNVTMYLEGAATFIRLPQLASALEATPANTNLHVHFEGLSYIDHACLNLLMTWEKQHEATGGSLEIDWDSLRARFQAPIAQQNGTA